MKHLTAEERQSRREALESAMIGTRWFTPQMLADRWGLSSHTVREIPEAQLRFKDFGRGARKRRRYKEEWVVAFENTHGTPVAPARSDAA